MGVARSIRCIGKPDRRLSGKGPTEAFGSLRATPIRSVASRRLARLRTLRSRCCRSTCDNQKSKDACGSVIVQRFLLDLANQPLRS